MEDMKVAEIFNKFYGELAVKSKVPDTGKTFPLPCFIYINNMKMIGQ